MTGSTTLRLEVPTYPILKAFEEALERHDEPFILHDSNDPSPVDLLVIELDQTAPEKTLSHISSVLHSSPSTDVIMTGASADFETLLKGLRVGIKEFLPSPFEIQDVHQALNRLKLKRQQRVAMNSSGRSARVLPVIGGKGGVGTTTICLNLAKGLQRADPHYSIALMDLNFLNSDLPLFLDLETTRGLAEISENMDRLDKDLLWSMLLTHESGLRILPSGGQEGAHDGIPPSAVEQTVKLMQPQFDFILVDCGQTVTPLTNKVLELAPCILVAMTLNLAVIRGTKRLLEYFKDRGYPESKIKLLINRYTSNDELLLKDTEENLQHKTFRLLPNDYVAANTAINVGKTIDKISPRSPLTKSYQDLAVSLITQDGESKPSILSKPFQSIRSLRSKHFSSTAPIN